MRRFAFGVLAILYLFGIYALPAAIAAGPVLGVHGVVRRTIASAAAPFLFLTLVPLVAGVFSLSHRRFVKAGKFRRDVGERDYFHRRLYGACWTAVYYLKPALLVVGSFPALQRAVFRLFGYRGDARFTFYPDSWIRDLRLLDFGRGAYISNRATLGTNMVLANGRILVGAIRVGEKSVVGHLAMIGPGVTIGREVEVGVGTAIGIGTTLEDGVRVGPTATVEHGVRIGTGTSIGACAYVGSGAVIAAGVRIPAGSIIPARAEIRSDDDLRALRASAVMPQQRLLAIAG